MYAIIEVAGKQYKVEKGLTVYVDRLSTENKKTIDIDKVLFLKEKDDVKIGAPYVEGAVVKATVIEQEVKDKKVIVYKYKNKTGYHKKQGHRQRYTMLEIKDITVGVKTKKEAKVEKEAVKETKTVTKKTTEVSTAKVAEKKTTAKASKAKIEKKTAEKPAKKELSKKTTESKTNDTK